MNLLLINYEYPPIGAGAAWATYNIALRLVHLGHSVTVLTSQFKEKTGIVMEDGVEVVRCRSMRRRAEQSNLQEMASFFFAAAMRLHGLLKIRQFESSIVFFSFPCGPLGLLCRYFARTPYIISLRGGDVPGSDSSLETFHRLLKPLRRLILRNAHAIVANSKSLRQLAEKADPFKIRVIPNGVDTDFFYPGPKEKKAEDEPFAFLYVGRLQSRKNLPVLLDQLHKLRLCSLRPFRVHIVGDGPDRDNLQNLARELKLSDLIVWHGWLEREAVRNLYQSSDAFINPSLGEGMPNAVLEAMACGLPIIASNVAGNDELVHDQSTGFLFNLHDVDALMLSLKTVLEERERALSIGIRGSEWVRNTFSWEAVAKEYVHCFNVKDPIKTE